MPPPSQWRPEMPHSSAAGSAPLLPSRSNEHPGRPPSRTGVLEPPGSGASLPKCASERCRRTAAQRG
eukprot:9120416-Prorocentrum_lima.AAC.1